MTWRTSFFLVLLQLAIGVHLLYEGWWKMQNPAWSSEGYLRASTGPLALPVRYLAGDPDVTWQDDHFAMADPNTAFVARLTPKPFDPHEASTVWHKYMPEPVQQEWQAYYDKFVQHYPLDEKQREEAKTKFTVAENDFVKWLVEGTRKKAPPNFTGPAADVPRKTPDRVRDYLNKLQEIRDLETQEVATFGPRLTAKLTKARDDARTMKRELQEDLDDHTAQMKASLHDVLSYEQKRMAPPAEEAKPKAAWSRLAWIDNTVRWGLVVAGAGLILGLFTRLACLIGALLLLMFYLAVPPWPGLPENPPVRGHYLFVNENVIEILALMVVATSKPGWRYGLDAWLPFHWFRRRHTTPVERPQGRKGRAREFVVDADAPTPAGRGVAAPVSHSPTRRDSSHGS